MRPCRERGMSAPTNPATPSNALANALAHADHHRTVLAKSHARFSTTAPPAPPPALTCPWCDRSLNYEHSHIGGVSSRHAEQWDYYLCPTCGSFQYRQRTRQLRRVH
jgi:hypothetical protein